MAKAAKGDAVYSTLSLTGGVTASTKIPIIRAIRELAGLGLSEAKHFADTVQTGQPQDLAVAAFWRPDLTASDRIKAAAKLLRGVGCEVKVL